MVDIANVDIEPVVDPGFWSGGDSLRRAEKVYELANHLGNVLAVVGDYKVKGEQAILVGGVPVEVSYYRAAIVQLTDFYPFGMEMPGRK